MRRKDQKGFTLMELMVVIVIVAILAAVAVPLYINYVRDAQRTEAKGAIAAIVTAEQVYRQRFGTYRNYSDAQFNTLPPPTDPIDRLDVDVREALVNWTVDVTLADENVFTVKAQGKGGTRPVPADMSVTYSHNRIAPPANPWQEE